MHTHTNAQIYINKYTSICVHGIVRTPALGNWLNRTKLREDIEGFHIAYGLDIDEELMLTFFTARLDIKNKQCLFLESTRVMDTTEDWKTRKGAEKDERYCTYVGFMNHLCRREMNGWKAKQINFTEGVKALCIQTHSWPYSNHLESRIRTPERSFGSKRSERPFPCLTWSSNSFRRIEHLWLSETTWVTTSRNIQQKHGKTQDLFKIR